MKTSVILFLILPPPRLKRYLEIGGKIQSIFIRPTWNFLKMEKNMILSWGWGCGRIKKIRFFKCKIREES
jgi:hypothetical protein